MNKTWVLAAFLMSGAAWAQPVTEFEGTSPASERFAPSASVWIQPLSLLTLTPFSAFEGSTLVMLPLGANIPLSDRTDLVFEVTPIWISQDCEGRCTTRGLAVAAGPAWTVLSTRPGSGFFVQPKLVGLVARDESRAEENWSETGQQLSLGLDVGYRMTRGHFFMAFVLGGSVGKGWNVPRSSESLFFSFLDWPERAREDKSVWDVNLNLVRIGGSF